MSPSSNLNKEDNIITASDNLSFTKISLFSDQFVLSAGSVLIDTTKSLICILNIVDEGNIWVLPKGRKDINETLSEAALRETYEETGYKCTLMNLDMKTRATSPSNEDHKDVVRLYNDICEPIMITIRNSGIKFKKYKLIFWYVTELEKNFQKSANTQMSNENFKSCFVSFEKCLSLLTYEEDKNLVQKAFKLYKDKYNK